MQKIRQQHLPYQLTTTAKGTSGQPGFAQPGFAQPVWRPPNNMGISDESGWIETLVMFVPFGMKFPQRSLSKRRRLLYFGVQIFIMVAFCCRGSNTDWMESNA